MIESIKLIFSVKDIFARMLSDSCLVSYKFFFGLRFSVDDASRLLTFAAVRVRFIKSLGPSFLL